MKNTFKLLLLTPLFLVTGCSQNFDEYGTLVETLEADSNKTLTVEYGQRSSSEKTYTFSTRDWGKILVYDNSSGDTHLEFTVVYEMKQVLFFRKHRHATFKEDATPKIEKQYSWHYTITEQ